MKCSTLTHRTGIAMMDPTDDTKVRFRVNQTMEVSRVLAGMLVMKHVEQEPRSSADILRQFLEPLPMSIRVKGFSKGLFPQFIDIHWFPPITRLGITATRPDNSPSNRTVTTCGVVSFTCSNACIHAVSRKSGAVFRLLISNSRHQLHSLHCISTFM